MGYRRSKETADAARRWRRFVDEQRGRFATIGLPGSLMDDQGLFDQLLMHGYVLDGSGFQMAQLDRAQWAALDELVTEYLGQFDDPGVALGPRPD